MSHQDAHALGMSWAGDTGFARLPRDTDGRTPDHQPPGLTLRAARHPRAIHADRRIR
jgi:hypothetical protein